MVQIAEERRVFPRFLVDFPLKIVNLFTNVESDAQAKDISVIGIGIETAKEVMHNLHLEIWLRLSDGTDALYGKGHVVWSNTMNYNVYRAGIRLDKVDPVLMSRFLGV